jgi:hypothetical protein
VTVCNVCGVVVNGPRSFLCVKHYRLVPPRLIKAYHRACDEVGLYRSRREEPPITTKARLAATWDACRNAAKENHHGRSETAADAAPEAVDAV